MVFNYSLVLLKILKTKKFIFCLFASNKICILLLKRKKMRIGNKLSDEQKRNSTQIFPEKMIVDGILTESISKQGIQNIVEALQIKNYIVSAVLPQTPESETFGHFLDRFWNFEKSPYVHEKLVVGQSIHKRYIEIMHSRAMSYWIPRYGNSPLGSITKEDIKKSMWCFATQLQKIRTRKKGTDGEWIYEMKAITGETVNQAVRAATCALKWAYHNGLTKNDCFSGLMYCHVVPKKRCILTMDQTKLLFAQYWKDESYKLANLTAMCTGLRIGEVQALQIQDITNDCIYVRHNWARRDGLKCPKNGETRELKIPLELSNLLFNQIDHNPFGHNPDDFVFFGYTRNIPCGCRHWNEALHSILKKLEIPNYKNITFHSWRHFFTANMADHVDERKLQLATGHKTLDMLEHYAAHESQQTLNELGSVAKELFLPIIMEV